MFSEKMRMLVLAPHTDDAEFGCGGSISRLIEEGHHVMCIAFSAAESSVPAPWPSDVLRHEIAQATKILGIAPSDLQVLSYPVRQFAQHRQEILDVMVQAKKDLSPDIVFLPSINDTHQDHQVIAQEGFRAYKHISMLGYELPWNNLSFNTNFFVFLEERHILKKIEALDCYASQKHRSYASAEFIRSLAHTRGTQMGSRYAEVFEAIRLVHR